LWFLWPWYGLNSQSIPLRARRWTPTTFFHFRIASFLPKSTIQMGDTQIVDNRQVHLSLHPLRCVVSLISIIFFFFFFFLGPGGCFFPSLVPVSPTIPSQSPNVHPSAVCWRTQNQPHFQVDPSAISQRNCEVEDNNLI